VTEYYIGIGSNMGNREYMLRKAVETLRKCDGIVIKSLSSIYETPPWGKINQASFLNAALKIESELDPEDTLRTCLAVEIALGRVRHEKWGARTIDLDLLCSPAIEMETVLLTLPHPYMTQRAFVLVPLHEIAPGLMVKGRTIEAWMSELNDVDTIKFLAPMELQEDT